MAHTEPRWPEPPAQNMRPPTPGPRWPDHDDALEAPPGRTPTPPAAAKSPAQPASSKTVGRRTSFKAPWVPPWVAALLAAAVIVEAGVIAALLSRRPAQVASVDQTVTAGAEQTQPELTTVSAPAEPTPANEAAAPPPASDAQRRPDASAAIAQAASNQRSGGVRMNTPIALIVLQGDRVLGSTADGPIVATAGTHQLELVNTALGFRTRRAVTFRAGAITTLEISVPPGRVSVNAQPWAEVLIDNRPVGETPLANLSVPIGEHEILFRHPELGERRQTITVRADAPTRVSTTFDR